MRNNGQSCNDCGLPGEPVPGQEDVYAWVPPTPPDHLLTDLSRADARPTGGTFAADQSRVRLPAGIPPEPAMTPGWNTARAAVAANFAPPAAPDMPPGGFLESMIRDAISDAGPSTDVEYLPRLGAPCLEPRPVTSALAGAGESTLQKQQLLSIEDGQHSWADAETKRDKELDDLLESYEDSVTKANELERAVEQARKADRIGPREDLAEAVKQRVALAKQLREALERDRKLQAELRKEVEKGGAGAPESGERLARVTRRIRLIKDALEKGSKTP